MSQSDSDTVESGVEGKAAEKMTAVDTLSLAQIAEEVEQAVGGRIIGEEAVESVKQVSE